MTSCIDPEQHVLYVPLLNETFFTGEVVFMKRCHSMFRPSTLMFAVTIAIVAFCTISSNPPHALVSQEGLKPRQHPRIQIKDQPDSPLGILSAQGDSATAHVPQVGLVVVNRTIQSVRAYTLRYQTISNQSTGGGAELTSANSVNSLLQPGHTISAILGEGASYTDPIRKIVVSVDFVELADGTTWGPDEYKSNESLAGQRAGAHEFIEHLMKILSKDGPLAVMESIEGSIADVVPSDGHSPEWLNGFDGGVSAMRERIKTAYNKAGVGVIESELRRPFDASDRR